MTWDPYASTRRHRMDPPGLDPAVPTCDRHYCWTQALPDRPLEELPLENGTTALVCAAHAHRETFHRESRRRSGCYLQV